MTQLLMEFKTLLSKETEEYSDEMSSLVYGWSKVIQAEFLKSSRIWVRFVKSTKK